MSLNDQENDKKFKHLMKSVGCSSTTVDTNHWLFHEKCPSKNKYGPYEKAWREKFDIGGKPLKAIVAESKSCLPKISPAFKQSHKDRLNPVYTRFNCGRLSRKEEMRKTEVDLSERLSGETYKRETATSRKSTMRNEFSSTAWFEQAPAAGNSDGSSTAKSSKTESDNSGDSSYRRKHSLNTDLESIVSKKGNPYIQWAKPPKLSRQDKKKKKAALQSEQEHQILSQAEERVDLLVGILCDSIVSLGGPENNIEPQTVHHLFASGYDTTPAMSEGISLVKPGELPAGLKHTIGSSRNDSMHQADVKRMLGDTSADAFKKIFKNGRHAYRYGAYYLDPNQWEWLRKDDSISDPRKKLWAEEISELDAKRKEMAEEMSQLHILSVYAEWLRSKGSRIPECVLEAEQYRAEREERERLRAEAELKARQEYLMKKMKGL